MERLSAVDARFLYAEDSDRHISLAVGAICVLDGPMPDYENLVQYSTDGGATWITTQKSLVLDNPNSLPTQRQATITGLTVATPYKFRVISRNFAGDTSSNVLDLATAGQIDVKLSHA